MHFFVITNFLLNQHMMDCVKNFDLKIDTILLEKTLFIFVRIKMKIMKNEEKLIFDNNRQVC